MQNKSIRILLVEDDDIDAISIKRGFQQAKIANEIVRVKDGIEALTLLRDQAKDELVKKPFVILLDLKMPRMDGFGFLNELRKDPVLHQIIVFVLTTSNDDEDRMRAYDKYVAGYIVKAAAGKGFVDLITMLDHYWRVVELPL
jgi:CheY-like chemotaxis protein